MLQNSYDLIYGLKKMGYLKSNRDPLWWPHSGTFEVVIGTILTQQTKWERVEESLAHLKERGICSLEGLHHTEVKEIASLIKPSGFYNTKAQRLQLLCTNILKEFGSFETFKDQVNREWLLSQKGIGMESADSILCYGCGRDVFVVDSYTQRLLGAFGYTFEGYMQIQDWMQEGIEENFDKVQDIYKYEIQLHSVYARFHGKMVEYAKTFIHGKQVEIAPLIQSMEGKR